jgi:hypothetical protein
MHGGDELCMFAGWEGHLQVCCNGSKRMELLGTVVISCAQERGHNYVVEWARENGCPEP